MKKILFLTGCMLLFMPVFTQTNVPVVGISDERPEIYGLKNARVVTSAGNEAEKLDILVEQGRIRAVGKDLDFPEACIEVDLEGKIIYPSFVDIHSTYGLPAVKRTERQPWQMLARSGPRSPEQDKPETAAYWNQGIRLENNAVSEFRPDKKSADALRKAGFGAVVSVKKDGIARGTSPLVCLSDKTAREVILNGWSTANFSFDRGSSEDRYPMAQYGAIALLRQMYLDGQWYEKLPQGVFYDEALEALAYQKDLPKIFEVKNAYEVLRADAIAREFGMDYIVCGDGSAYQLADQIKDAGVSLVIPLDFPEAPDVKDPYEASTVALSKLKHWELAPANAAMLSSAGIDFAITADGLKKPQDFLPALRKAVKSGLSRDEALRALTSKPASMIGASELVGAIRENMVANLLVCSGDIFDQDCVIYQNWVQGVPYTFISPSLPDIRGEYALVVGDSTWPMRIQGKHDVPRVEIKSGEKEMKSTLSYKDGLVSIVLAVSGENISLSGTYCDGILKGDAVLADGSWVKWHTEEGEDGTWKRKPVHSGAGESDGAASKSSPGQDQVPHPFRAFGWKDKPVQEDILFRNATVWTLDEQGKLENADVLVKDGKIAAVGTDLKQRGVRVVDGTGMHVTPGIIDEHSHIAMTSTNEMGQAITSEVRVGDIVDPTDPTIYRQLSGGVTAAHILHGSANPIGGQSVLIKHRWGSSAEEMKIQGQVGFLKHALGENVKRSTNRYPNTRMGVEHIIRDAYQRAGDYRDQWNTYETLPDKEKAGVIPPRRELELEALVDVLEERSFIECHTYVQSEAMMIMKLAEDFDIRVNTLIHMNEGFKLADKIAEHGAAASVFADWWDYKYEVYEGINYNAATLVQQGVLTCINSDDAEMGRRLNQEAAKTMKYGGLDEIQALKLVTLNPAKVLFLDDRMGSIEEGKDADLVLWTGHPLSVYSRAKMTLVDGIVYFDEDEDAKMKLEIDQERNRIIQKILKEESSKGPGGSARSKTNTIL